MRIQVAAIGALAALGVGVGALVTTSMVTAKSAPPARVIHVHSVTGVSADARDASATELAQRSFGISGMHQVLLVKVTGIHGVHAIIRDHSGHPAKIVTDYSITILKTWARGDTTAPSLLRIPGGSAEGTIETFEDGPTVNLGGQYLVWDKDQPPAAAAGPSQPNIAVVPSSGNIATVTSDGLTNWNGKTSTLQALESALTLGSK